jgi:hypothetical protein
MSIIKSFQNHVIANLVANEETKACLNDFFSALDTDLDVVHYGPSTDVEEAEQLYNKSLIKENTLEPEDFDPLNDDTAFEEDDVAEAEDSDVVFEDAIDSDDEDEDDEPAVGSEDTVVEPITPSEDEDDEED